MKKFLLIAMAACIACFTGCKTIPEKETVAQKAYTAGLAAGYAASLVPQISAQDKTNVVVIVTLVEKFTPQDGQTVTEAWTPVINDAITTLVAQGKLDEGQAALVRTAANLATSGIDYLFVKHPEWKEEKDIVAVVIHQACAGFKAGIGINPENKEVVDLVNQIMDKEVFLSLTGPAPKK